MQHYHRLSLRAQLLACSLFLIPHAWAEDVIELKVPSTPPPDLGSGHHSVATSLPSDLPDGLHAESEEGLTCTTSHGRLRVSYSASESSWPTLPLETECVLDEESIPVLIMPQQGEWDGSSVYVQDGVTLGFSLPANATLLRTYVLPKGSWTDAKIPSGLEGVTCEVMKDTSSPRVQLEIGLGAQDGMGSCELRSVDGVTLTLHIRVDRP